MPYSAKHAVNRSIPGQFKVPIPGAKENAPRYAMVFASHGLLSRALHVNH
jgi:hypothetical protein